MFFAENSYFKRTIFENLRAKRALALLLLNRLPLFSKTYALVEKAAYSYILNRKPS
jgi:hypothetical protein